jgi:hypothetical protein
LPLEELVEVRLCDLDLDIRGTALEKRVAKLSTELARGGLGFRPYVWLSNDWFTPDACTGFAIPFYLAHPRLARLERSFMLEVEGGTGEWCMRILRHETAHALDNAYRLHRTQSWRDTFGKWSTPYREAYVPQPLSRHHVLNLDDWYSQSHPAEDWAETFAVWLQPKSGWRTRYATWPALGKLEWVDRVMKEIGTTPPKVRSRHRPDSLPSLRITIGEHYRRRQARYADTRESAYDEALSRVFSAEPSSARRDPAARFLMRHERELRERVAAVTGQHPYLIQQVHKELVRRSRHLGLRLRRSVADSRIDVAVLLTTLTMRFLHGGVSEYRR